MAYTNINDPSAYFQAKTYTGNATDNTPITNDGNSDLQPDWIWIKRRSSTENHVLADSTRGVTKWLFSNLTNAEGTSTARIKSFDTNGFTLGDTGSTNQNGANFVAWQWKANGGTTSSNTDGDLRSVTVQANQDAGFSIVDFLGGTTPYTAGHGLGVAPDVIISKRRGATVGWYVYHKDLGAGKYLQLNSSAAAVTSATVGFTSAPTSTIFTGGTGVGSATDYYINYCFAEKQGYSKFGSYVGNGSSNGPFIYTGFKPAFVMVKNTNATYDWRMNGPDGVFLSANTSGAVYDSPPGPIDRLSNGFKIRGGDDVRQSGSTFIYMAFAANPFVTSTGIPTTAGSTGPAT
jgi:hypothetical protein